MQHGIRKQPQQPCSALAAFAVPACDMMAACAVRKVPELCRTLVSSCGGLTNGLSATHGLPVVLCKVESEQVWEGEGRGASHCHADSDLWRRLCCDSDV